MAGDLSGAKLRKKILTMFEFGSSWKASQTPSLSILTSVLKPWTQLNKVRY